MPGGGLLAGLPRGRLPVGGPERHQGVMGGVGRRWPLEPLYGLLEPRWVNPGRRGGAAGVEALSPERMAPLVVLAEALEVRRRQEGREPTNLAAIERCLYRARASGGAPDALADELACALGLVPSLVWPEWEAVFA